MHAVFQSGVRPQASRRGRKRLVIDVQIDLLIRGIIGEFAPVRFPPRLPTPGLPRQEPSLQRLPSRIITAMQSRIALSRRSSARSVFGARR